MLDMFGLPKRTNSDVQMFTSASSGASNGWQVWRKPRGASMVYVFAVHGGGGGGAGFGGAATTSRAGGGSGGGGGFVKSIIPAILVPDQLFVICGVGGAGGVGNGSGAGTAGTSGGVTFVCLAPRNTTPSSAMYIIGGIGVGGGAGGAGGSATGGTAGSAGSFSSQTPTFAAGIYQGLAGDVGLVGGAANVASANKSIIVSATSPSGGGSGSGCIGSDLASGSVVSSLGFDIDGRCININSVLSQGGTSASPNGANGSLISMTPLIIAGGAGGAGINATAGGNGGNGIMGSGGGGGGAGFTGGNGGKGGDGFVIIVAW